MTDRPTRGAPPRQGAPPTDLELMLYADGELDEARVAEVEAWLAGSSAGRSKLSSLQAVSGVIRDSARERSAGVDLTDAIMRRVEGPKAAVPKTPGRPGNDNARIYAVLAGALVAAAAAIFVWLSPGAAPHRPVARTMPAMTSLAPMGIAPPSASHGPAEADVEHGVEVAAVDFGASTGAVLYIQNGASLSDTTTLVWLSDDSGEDE